MSEKDTGGGAFPQHVKITDPDTGYERWYSEGGMTLRDHFAIEALKGIGTWVPSYGEDGKPLGLKHADLCNPDSRRVRAAWAYAQADAMIEERSK